MTHIVEETIESIEEQIKVFDSQIELGESIKRLESNPDFIKVVVKQYFEKHPIHLSDMYGISNLNENVREAIRLDLTKVGYFKDYLRKLKESCEEAALGKQEAINAIEEYNNEQEEIA